MKTVTVTLCDPSDHNKTFDLNWEVLNHSVGHKWFERVGIDSSKKIVDPTRFYNFPNDGWNPDKILQEMLDCIQTINTYCPNLIQHIPTRDMEQNVLNELHHYFEIYHGTVDGLTDFIKSKPRDVMLAFGRLNILIHRWEDYVGTQTFKFGSRARFVLVWEPLDRFPLDDSDYQYFTMHRQFGYVYLNYAEIGKPILDAYYDKDEVLEDSFIKPLRYYSGEMHAWLGSTVPIEHTNAIQEDLWQWFDSKMDCFNRLGFKKYDPKLALGYLPVGKLITDGMTEEEIRIKINKHLFMKKVSVQET